jgi:hypothetical protein
MASFIKLSSLVINSAKISSIEILENKYCIHLISHKIDGFFLFTSGFINTLPDKIEVCKVQHPSDYNRLSDWINRIN